MCIAKEMNVAKREIELLRKEVGEWGLQSINKDTEVIEAKRKEEDLWVMVVKKLKIRRVIDRLEKLESDMIVKMSVIRKEVKSTNEEETRKKIIMIYNLKSKAGKSDVECVKDVFENMGANQSCDDIVDAVRIRQKGNVPIIRKFRSKYDKWTVMRIKIKLREREEYRRVFRDGSIEGGER